MNFKELNIVEPILKAIDKAGYTEATEIQETSIPLILNGNDLIGCAQTGTGKTAAFAIPILQLLHENPKKSRKIRALVVTPTRELAIQISDNFKDYKGNTKLNHLAIFGGVKQKAQVNAIKNGVDVLIATPGRLLDLMNQGFINLKEVEILVLDEADRMLDMGFINDIKKILKVVPQKRQTLFFSATMPKKIRQFAHSILNSPKEINVSPVSSTAESVTQSVYMVEQKQKQQLLINLLKSQDENRSLIFTRTKHGANRLIKTLTSLGINSAAIHGNKSQASRQRALEDFKNNKLTVLVATDIAARGIDVENLSFVINYEIPNHPETYVHRIGRTGRGGNFGEAVSFCSSTELSDFKSIEKLIGLKIPINKN